MAHLLFVVLSLALLAGFLALTEYEARRGSRVFSAHRERLDARIQHLEFVIAHADIPALLREELEHLAARVGHDIAHLSLQAVRVAERLLTRLVRHLRSRHSESEVPRGQAREFVRTLSDFKDNLKQNFSESDIQK
jgi:hypothetical protein